MPQMRPIWHMRIFTDPTLTHSCTPAYKIFKDHLQDPISHILTTDELTKDESHNGVYFTAIQPVFEGKSSECMWQFHIIKSL